MSLNFNELGYFSRLERVMSLNIHSPSTVKELYSRRKLCIGLDPNRKVIDALYGSYGGTYDKKVLYCLVNIVNETSGYVCAYKINNSFYQFLNNPNEVIKQLIEHIRNIDIGEGCRIQIILDPKIGDVEHSVDAAVSGLQEQLDVDAITINPYCGFESYSFLAKQFPKTGFYILLRTPNPQEFSIQRDCNRIGSIGELPLYYSIAKQINDIPNFGGVFGASNINELRNFCIQYKYLNLLSPGIGTQGGNLSRCSEILGNRGLITISSRITDQEKFFKSEESEESEKSKVPKYFENVRKDAYQYNLLINN